MEERTKQIMRRYLIREFDELNIIRSSDFQNLDKEEVKAQIRKYIEESYEDGHEGVFYLLGLAAFKVNQKQMQKVIYHKIDGKTFEDRIDEIWEESKSREQPQDLPHNDKKKAFEPYKLNADDSYKLERIAVTEGHRAYVNGQSDAGQDIQEKKGVTLYKRWDATMDDKTRKTHRLLNGQLKMLDEVFTTENGSATAPGMFGIAEEDVNCRCILTFTAY